MAAVSDGRLRRPHTAWHCCLEFFAVATRLPEEFRLVPRDAFKLLEEEILARFEIHELPESARRAFWKKAVDAGVIGGRIYDVHIAEVARAGGADGIITDNRRHFASWGTQGMSVLSAQEFLEEAEL